MPRNNPDSLFLKNLKPYVAGQCFLCLESCLEGAYLHSACAIAYWDDKNKRIKFAGDACLQAEQGVKS